MRQALDRGYAVIAYAHNPGKIKFGHEALCIVQGELDDLALLEKAISGADCVISLLGPSGNVVIVKRKVDRLANPNPDHLYFTYRAAVAAICLSWLSLNL